MLYLTIVSTSGVLGGGTPFPHFSFDELTLPNFSEVFKKNILSGNSNFSILESLIVNFTKIIKVISFIVVTNVQLSVKLRQI